jgi:hypothetical protein
MRDLSLDYVILGFHVVEQFNFRGAMPYRLMKYYMHTVIKAMCLELSAILPMYLNL